MFVLINGGDSRDKIQNSQEKWNTRSWLIRNNEITCRFVYLNRISFLGYVDIIRNVFIVLCLLTGRNFNSTNFK